MEWIRNISLFLVLSGLLLELIADTKYYKFAQWVTGVILLLQFIQPFTNVDVLWSKFTASFQSFDYAMGTDKIVEELYIMEEQTERTVLSNYKASISEQIEKILQKSELHLEQIELEIKQTGEIEWMKVRASYKEKEEVQEIQISEVTPIKLDETIENNMISPIELYIQECLAEFYQMDKNKIEVVIQETN